MGYEKTTVKKIIKQINEGKICLPAIQRKFVWDVWQIERLFDSIMLKYPIGTFLFWQVEKERINDYVFYKFIQEYHERDPRNELKNRPETNESLTGVLDGQQRLTALYLALQGSYAIKKPRARWSNDDAFPKRQLYFNLLRNTMDDNEGITYEFKFLTEEDINNHKRDLQKNGYSTHYWFPVKEALTWEQSRDYMPYLRENKLIDNDTAMDNLQLLWQCIVNDDIINYYEIQNQDLDDILDIFVRVNSGGTPLSKSDLLFSTIVANWEDAREKIDDLLSNINGIGDGFNFNTDFIMRLCLTLIDSPVKFKVSNFKKANVDAIKENWIAIEAATKKTVRLLAEFGLSKETLTTQSIVVPLVYYVYKGGNIDGVNKTNIQKYLVYGMLKKAYGSYSDSVISTIRDVLRTYDPATKTYSIKNHNFDFAAIQEKEKKFTFDMEDIDVLFDYKKGPYTFLVLSLLNPNIKFTQVNFHQDHVHPYSTFVVNTQRELNISDQEWEEWKENKDKLANLQLLEGRENESKRATPFDKWFEANVSAKGAEAEAMYCASHHIPENEPRGISNFVDFYNERKSIMHKALEDILL